MKNEGPFQYLDVTQVTLTLALTPTPTLTLTLTLTRFEAMNNEPEWPETNAMGTIGWRREP